MAIDLHVHSTYSDGCLTPGQIVTHASQAGITALALTDHDTLDGIPEALACGKELGITVLPGIELSCSLENQGDYHILGYKMDCNHEPLLAQLRELSLARAERADRIVAKLAVAGIQIDGSRVREIAGAGVVGRPHIAEALIEQGFAEDKQDAFRRYLSPGQPGYVPRYRLSVAQAIGLIRAAGGIPVWAHPGQSFSLERLEQFQEYGLLGLEVWHPDHSAEQMLWFADRVARAGLLVTGGSDFHCYQLHGPGLGSHITPEWAFAALVGGPEAFCGLLH